VAAESIVGFDPATRSWVTAAHAAEGVVRTPTLDGTLALDETSLVEVSDDFGYTVHRRPLAVLKPGSVEDIASMVRFARQSRLQIAARGQGHSTYGQPQVEAGIVIDMSAMAAIHRLDNGAADVEAGVLWSALLDAALARGQTPPVLPDYIELTVGGTLAVGGIGGMSSRYGAQIDHVLALTVVTGKGEIVECSSDRNRDLFEAVLGGLGQYGIVARATVRLVPAPAMVRVYTAFYSDLASFTRDQARVVEEQRFDYVEGQALPNPAGGWMYMLEAAAYYTPSTPSTAFPAHLDDATLLAGLGNDLGPVAQADRPYRDFARRLDALVASLKEVGAWSMPHPWFDVFVPGGAVVDYLEDVMAHLTVADTGNGPVVLYPVLTARFTRPRLQLPDEPVVFLFDILRFAVPPTPEVVNSMLEANRAFYDRVVALGGTRYPIGAIPDFDQKDWERHYGGEWGAVVRGKDHFDPQNVLTPGQGIFK
jgi:FAD/FMN-containing dehydrogenase